MEERAKRWWRWIERAATLYGIYEFLRWLVAFLAAFLGVVTWLQHHPLWEDAGLAVVVYAVGFLLVRLGVSTFEVRRGHASAEKAPSIHDVIHVVVVRVPTPDNPFFVIESAATRQPIQILIPKPIKWLRLKSPQPFWRRWLPKSRVVLPDKVPTLLWARHGWIRVDKFEAGEIVVNTEGMRARTPFILEAMPA